VRVLLTKGRWFTSSTNKRSTKMTSSKGLLTIALLCCAISSAIAADCFSGTQNTILVADIMNLANDFGTNNINPPVDNPLGFSPLSTHSVSLGSAIFCIRNSNVFAGTHINLSDVQFGANDIVSQCCNSANPNCQGGQFTIRGNTGATVILNVAPVEQGCEV
jgi:hypothetical protein